MPAGVERRVMERRGPDALGHVGAGRDGGGGSPRGLGAVTEQEDLQGRHADVCVCVFVFTHACVKVASSN